MASTAHEDLDDRLLHRLLFFTDAVFAIVMTLLVLELRPPEGDAAAQLAGLHGMSGKFFAFGLSFGILGIFWVAHMATTRRLARFDWLTAVVNLFFLFPICLLPFTSAWMGERMPSIPAWSAYSIVLMGCSTANVALVLVQTRGGGRLLAEPVTPAERLYRVARASMPGFAFLFGYLGANAGYISVARFCWVLIPVFIGLLRLARPTSPVPTTPARPREGGDPS